jgi:hypothetical protein
VASISTFKITLTTVGSVVRLLVNAEMTLMTMMAALDAVTLIVEDAMVMTMSLLVHVDMMDVVATAALSLAAV